MRKASLAQAKRLAELWSGCRELWIFDDYNDATSRSLVGHGWVEPTGEKRSYPNGHVAERHRLTEAGRAALKAAI